MMQKRPAAAPKSSKAGSVLREDGRRGSRRRNAEKLTEGEAPEAVRCSSPREPLFYVLSAIFYPAGLFYTLERFEALCAALSPLPQGLEALRALILSRWERVP